METEPRGEMIAFFVTPKEMEFMKKMAEGLGFDSVSEYIRFYCLDFAEVWITDGIIKPTST